MNLSFLRNAFRTDVPYWRAIVTLSALAIVPSIGFVLIAFAILALLGVDAVESAPELPVNDPAFIFLAIVVGPLVETALLVVVLKVIGLVVESANARSGVSGIGWGVAHGIQAPPWFFGTFWSFFVFSRAYLAWRKISRSRGFGAACLPHAIQNTVAFALIRLDGSV